MSIRISGGVARGLRLPPVKEQGTRPTSGRVRSAIFSILGDAVDNARVLDLFAGSGAYGIEALSRGAMWADFVESHSRRCSALRSSLQHLQYAERAAVYCAKAERATVLLEGSYGIVFLDPPYGYTGMNEFMDRLMTSQLVDQHTLVVLEHSRHDQPLAVHGAFPLAKQRRYGETVISIYAYGRAAW